MQEGKFRPSAGTEIAAEGEVDSSKNAVPDITADILTAEACNLRICCEKTDHRNGNKLNRNNDDQSENDSNQCSTPHSLFGTLLLSSTDVLRAERRNSGKHGRWNQEQEADDFLYNTDCSRCFQATPVSDDGNDDKGDLNKTILQGDRNTDFKNLSHHSCLRGEIRPGKTDAGITFADRNQCQNDAECLGKRGSKRGTGWTKMQGAHKEIVECDIGRTCDCDEVHRAFRITKSTEDGTDDIIRGDEWNTNETDRQISDGAGNGFGWCGHHKYDRLYQKKQDYHQHDGNTEK